MMLINDLIQVIIVKISIDPQKQVKNKKVLGKFKDELGGVIMNEFFALRAKTYTFKLDNNHEVKKAKDTKKCVI